MDCHYLRSSAAEFIIQLCALLTGRQVCESVITVIRSKSSSLQELMRFCGTFLTEHPLLGSMARFISSGNCSSRLEACSLAFFGEVYSGATPRGYEDADAMIRREDINPEATVEDLWVYSTGLESFGKLQLTHFAFAHWLVLFRDSDSHWWSLEHVGRPLLQRLGCRNDFPYIKGLWNAECHIRPDGRFPTKKFRTAGKRHRTMREVAVWIIDRRCNPYNAITYNCQNFGADFSEFLSDKRPLYIPVKLAPIAPVFAPLLKVLNLIQGRTTKLLRQT
jgi:hypothetical protein